MRTTAALIQAARWPVVGFALLVTIVCSVWGPGVFGEVRTAGSFVVADSESERTAERLADRFPESDPDVLAVLSPTDGASAEDPGFRAEVEAWADDLPEDAVRSVVTPWSASEGGPDPRLVADDGTQLVVLVTMAGASAQERNDDFVALAEDATSDAFTVQYAGAVPTEAAVGEQSKQDVTNAEMWSMPLLSVLLIIVFGSVVSSLLPVLIAGAATMGSFAALRLIAGVTDVSIFAVTIASILALVLAVDYGLIVVSRYREELARGRRGVDALEATLRTAGETVAVSGTLVAVSLSVLLLFPQDFLRSMAYGGLATLAVALVFALVVLPAFLAILGPKVDALRVPGRLRRDPTERGSTGLIAVVARAVMRRPVLTLLVVVIALTPLVAPMLGLKLGSVDHRVLPSSDPVHQAAEDLEDGFSGIDPRPLTVLVDGAEVAPTYIEELEGVNGVSGVDVAGVDDDGHYLQVHLEDDWQSAGAEDAVADVRALDPPAGAEVGVGGASAEMVDQLDAIYDRAPIALGLLVLAVFLLLFAAFRSVVLPLKAILLNTLSVAVALGVMVFVFQDGHFSDLLGFTATGTLDPSNLILVFCLLFGLSMDYEVFMLARIKEQYDATGDNEQAVATGLQQSAGLITAAAALLLVVVGAFSFAGISFIQMIGVGMLVAITVDVLLIRTLLVPATMRLMGSANWWPGGRRTGGTSSAPPEVPGGTVPRDGTRTGTQTGTQTGDREKELATG